MIVNYVFDTARSAKDLLPLRFQRLRMASAFVGVNSDDERAGHDFRPKTHGAGHASIPGAKGPS